MKITTVSYTGHGRIRQLDLVEEITVTAELGDGDSVSDAVDLIREQVAKKLNYEAQIKQLQTKHTEAFYAYRGVVEKAEKMKEEWDKLSQFAVAQGLIKDIAEFPTEALNNLTKSLPPATAEFVSDSDF